MNRSAPWSNPFSKKQSPSAASPATESHDSGRAAVAEVLGIIEVLLKKDRNKQDEIFEIIGNFLASPKFENTREIRANHQQTMEKIMVLDVDMDVRYALLNFAKMVWDAEKANRTGLY